MKRLRSLIWFKIKRRLSKRRNRDLQKAMKALKENQVKIIEITNYLLSSTETKLIFSSLTYVYFLEYREIICKIEDDRIILTNGLYSYDISVNVSIISDIRDRFLNRLESKKRSVEKRAMKKLSSSLSRIHDQIIATQNVDLKQN